MLSFFHKLRVIDLSLLKTENKRKAICKKIVLYNYDRANNKVF